MRLLLFFILAPAWGWAEQVVEVQNKAFIICKYRKEVRTVRVHIDETGQCFTYYSKYGSEKVIGSGRYHATCLNFLNSVRRNLEASDWSCRDVTDSRLTATSAEEE